GLERVHAHDFHQIVLPVVGAMDIRVGAIRGEIARTNGVMIVRGTPHQGNVLGENRFVVFEVPRNSFLAESAVEHASAAPFFEIDERLDHLARYVSCTGAASPLDGALAHHATALLADSIGRKFEILGRQTSSISRALALIEARYAEPLTVGELARAA